MIFELTVYLVDWSPVFHYSVCNDLKQSVPSNVSYGKLLALSQRYCVCMETECKTRDNIPAGPVLPPESQISYALRNSHCTVVLCLW